MTTLMITQVYLVTISSSCGQQPRDLVDFRVLLALTQTSCMPAAAVRRILLLHLGEVTFTNLHIVGITSSTWGPGFILGEYQRLHCKESESAATNTG